MSTISSWVRKSPSSWFSSLKATPKPDSSNEAELVPQIVASLDEVAVRCQCHPDTESDQPHRLCKACRRFVDNCHWIQIFKLPSSQFANLSKRKWKRGAYIADGDAGRGLNWDYNHSLHDTTKGCHLCELMWTRNFDGNESSYTNFDTGMQIRLSVQYQPVDKNFARLGVYASNTAGKEISASLKIFHAWKPDMQNQLGNVPEAKPIAKIDSAYFPMGRCTGSNANLGLAKNWIQTCRRTHASCGDFKRPTLPFPSRLIDVGTDTEDPHLCEMDPHKSLPQYMTLSHCWGGKTPLTLTLASLEERKSGISFATLPMTFQEAIYVVRRLDFKYIWIDSLCIIQDSKEDWKRESEFMGDIYLNSVCTIAATASKDGSEGCFRLRNRPCQVWEDDERGIFVDTEGTVPLERYRRDVNSGPLNKRAWVLQERYLSPRILHFAENAVYWDCQETHLSDNQCEITDDTTSSWGFGDGVARLFDTRSPSFLDEFSDRWQFAVERYCSMGMTVKSDRIPAFRGVTKHLEKVSELECVSGLRKKYMLSHLLWRVGDAYSNSTTRITNSAPSWSWESLDGPAQYFPPNQDDLATTFWYPEDEGGWEKVVRNIADPNAAADTISDIFRQMELGVDPKSGYSSEKVYYSSYIEENSTDASLCVSAKLKQAIQNATIMIVRDTFTIEEETQIINTLQLNPTDTNTSTQQRLLICIWPDLTSPPLTLPNNDLLYLRIYIQGAKAPPIQRFLRHDPDETDLTNTDELAPNALHTTGLVLTPRVEHGVRKYSRVGFFRAIETFTASPRPHPKGCDPEDTFFKSSWFGEECEARVVDII